MGPLDVGPTTATVGIVGAGTMGVGIAQVALEAGERVVVHDQDHEALRRAVVRIRDGLDRRRGKQDLASTGSARLDVDEAMARLGTARDLEGVTAADQVIIETAVEDLEVKRAIFSRLDAVASSSTILATNTSALAVAAIAQATRNPSRVIGLHFFNPAPLMGLVEVVATPSADPALVEQAFRLMADWGKTPVRTTDSPGFIVNRVNRAFTLEALRMLELGTGSVDTIDSALRAAGFRMGPFELMDLVGLDVNLAAAQGLYAAFDYEPRFRPSVIQERLVEAGRLGRKTGEGFYWYGDDGRSLGVAGAFAEGPADRVASHRLLAAGDPGIEPPLEPTMRSDVVVSSSSVARIDPIVERIVLAIVNEGYRALADRVATAADVDLALRLGAGHPRGPFEQVADLGGPAAVVARLEGLAIDRRSGDRFAPAPGLLAAAART